MDISDANYDESKVSPYHLPDLLKLGGKAIRSPSDWQSKRESLLAQFRQHLYGETPPKSQYHASLLEEGNFLDLGWRKQIKLSFPQGVSYLLIYYPQAQKPLGCFLGLNFKGNHSINPDPKILLSPSTQAQSTVARGELAQRWNVETILKRGYALATLCYEDLFPDNPQAFETYANNYAKNFSKGQKSSAIAVWAALLSKAADYLESENFNKLMLIGHSRLGKAALWASAQDPRFTLTIANNSGCGGAALFKRCYGERIHHLNGRFPHWFCEDFKAYDLREEALPLDQHQLLALIAPRALYVTSAEEDRWADPKGEYLGLFYASRLYQLWGQEPFSDPNLPVLHQPSLTGKLGYHIRRGKHDVTPYDWRCFLDFADRVLGV
ncbi:MAG: hypothetical protein R2880_16175 [Deinococcales bacterium]